MKTYSIAFIVLGALFLTLGAGKAEARNRYYYDYNDDYYGQNTTYGYYPEYGGVNYDYEYGVSYGYNYNYGYAYNDYNDYYGRNSSSRYYNYDYDYSGVNTFYGNPYRRSSHRNYDRRPYGQNIRYSSADDRYTYRY